VPLVVTFRATGTSEPSTGGDSQCLAGQSFAPIGHGKSRRSVQFSGSDFSQISASKISIPESFRFLNLPYFPMLMRVVIVLQGQCFLMGSNWTALKLSVVIFR